MEISIADQIALDDALVAPADRLKIGKCNLRLSSDVTSKEATLQVAYDVLKLTPFYKAFQVSADVPEIYMQEFWATAYVHNRSVRFKMNNKKHILNLDQFRDILQICPKVEGSLTVNVNKLQQPCRSFAAIITTNVSVVNQPMTSIVFLKLKSCGKLSTQIITKRSCKETHSSHASGPGADEGTGVTPGVPDAPDYDSEDDISWKSNDDDQDDEKAQDDQDDEKAHDDEDDDKNDVNETTQDDEDDDVHDDDENAQDDDDGEQTESEDDGDDFIHPKLTTHDDEIIHEEETDEADSFDPTVHTPSQISSSDDEDSDNEIEGTNVEGAKSDEDATYKEDQGNEAVKDTNTNLEGRDDVMLDVLLPQVQATQEIEDTHVTLTPVNPDGQQQSSLKSLEDNFSELRQTNQYAEALSSIPGIVDQYLANKMQEAVDVAVQLKYDRIREESNTENQQFLDSIDEGMKKVIKEQVKKEVSKITPKIEKLVNDQLESEVLVRSSKEAKTSHAVAANLSELELKKILIDKMEANNSINRSDIQRQLYKALVDAYEADKILLDTYGDTVTIKRPRDGADDDQEPSAGTDRGSKRRRSGKEPASTSAPRETTTTTAGKTTTTGSKTHKQSASQSAPVEETMQTTNVFEAPAHQEFETGVHDEQEEEEVQHLPDWFQQPTRLPSPDHAWNKSVPAVHESVQPWLSNLARRQDPRESFDELTDTTFDFSAFVMNRLNVKTLTPELLAGPTFELMKGTCKSLTELEYFCEEVYKATTKKLDWINPEGRQYPHDLRQPLPLVPNAQGRHVIPFHHFINNDLEYLRGGESSRKYSTSEFVLPNEILSL
ncbi:hypothetical protein Tco_0331037 [Tanacetum coccineum]